MMVMVSKKVSRNLEAMGTDTDGWELCPIKWTVETRNVPVKVVCPMCRGSGSVPRRMAEEYRAWLDTEFNRIRGTDQRIDYTKAPYHEWTAECKRLVEENHGIVPRSWYERWGGHSSARCPRCWRSYSRRGHVYELQDREVEIGRPDWPEGTERRASLYSGYQCELCGKNGIYKSNLYPVLKRHKDGRIIGLVVGETCVKKLNFHYTRWRSVDHAEDTNTLAQFLETDTKED